MSSGQHREVIRDDQVVFFIGPGATRHTARLEARCAFVINGFAKLAADLNATASRWPVPASATIGLRLLHVRISVPLDSNGNKRAQFWRGRESGYCNRLRKISDRTEIGAVRPTRDERPFRDGNRCGARVSAVRTQPANPFENRRNSASDGRPEQVRKGDSGGESGIRTRDRVAPIHAFQACAFDRSATSPQRCHPAHRRAHVNCQAERFVALTGAVGASGAGFRNGRVR